MSDSVCEYGDECRVCHYYLIEARCSRVSVITRLYVRLEHFKYIRQRVDESLYDIDSFVGILVYQFKYLLKSIISSHEFVCPLLGLSESGA